MRKQAPEARIRNFDEVALGYTSEEARLEAKRCIQCKKPACVSGCPVEIDIPAFIKHIAEGDFAGAVAKLKEKNALPAICGRVCPQEDQCERVCIVGKKERPVAIGNLERFAADTEAMFNKGNPERPAIRRGARKVAVIGSGPAGLVCAGELAKMGYRVTIFESLHTPGGVLSYGIPEFRLPRSVLNREVEYVKSLGVEIGLNMLIGKIYTIDELFTQGFTAVFIGTGAGLPLFMGIPGENLCGVYSANEFLTRVNLMKAYRFPEYDTPIKVGRRVVVVGAGNVAFDSARCALRLGVEDVSIVYRRTEEEMPARKVEIEHAKEEGVRIIILTLPAEIFGDEKGYVRTMKCIKMKLGEPDESGRRRPIPIEGSEFNLDCDTVVIAIGQRPNPLISRAHPALRAGKDGMVIIDEKTGATNLPGVFAGGDIATGAATVIRAMGQAKLASRAIDEFLRKGT